MNIVWNSVSSEQQGQFLNLTGLGSMPEPSALDASQWNILAGIIGETAAEEIRQKTAGGGTIAEPLLDLPEDIGDWSSIMAMVAEIRMKIGELQEKTAVEDIKAQKDSIAEAHKLEAEKIKESLDKLGKAAKTSKWGKILGWAGAIIGCVAAVVVSIAVPAVAPLVLSLAALGLATMIAQQTGAMEKIIDFMAENPAALWAALSLVGGPIGFAVGATLTGLIEGGVLDEEKAKIAIQITVAAAMLAASVVGMLATGGASAANAASNVLRIIGMIAQGLGSLVSVANAGVGLAQTAYSYEAAMVQADIQENKAWLAKLQQMLSEEMDRLQQVIEQLTGAAKDASETLSDIAGSNRAVISGMSM